MRRWLRVGVYCLLVIALAIGLGLPTVVAYIQDGQTDQVIQTVSTTSVQLDLGTTSTLLQKYRMVEEADSTIKLDNAQKMEADQALAQLTIGLENLFSFEEEIPFDAEGFYEVNHSIRLIMEGEDSMIYWDFLLENDDGDRINAAVDDDTGVILYLQYSLNDADYERPWTNPALLGRQPLFMNPDTGTGEADLFSENGIFGNLEETGYSAEEFSQALQEAYCDTYLRRKGYRFSWELTESRYSGSSYLCSVMLVNNEGGYYVLTFSVSNNELTINP